MNNEKLRTELGRLIKNNSPLPEIEAHFQPNKLENFDINYRNPRVHDRCDIPLIKYLMYRANIEIFKYLKKQGTKIELSISVREYNIDCQKVSFNLSDNNTLEFNSTSIENYLQNKNNEQITQRFKNFQKILYHINKNTTIEEKNEVRLLHLSTYYLYQKLFNKLLTNPGIGVNAKRARAAEAVKIAAFDTRVRNDFVKQLYLVKT